MNILLIGNGMYSTGRGTKEFGTILPAIIEWQRAYGNPLNLTVTGTNEEHSALAREKYNQLSDLTGVELNIEFYPNDENKHLKNYRDILNSEDPPECAIIVVPDPKNTSNTISLTSKTLIASVTNLTGFGQV